MKGDYGPTYIFASNLRTDKQLEETKEFVQSLLEYVRFNPENLNRKPFLKKVLWRILHWNLPRVDAYLGNLVRALSGCVEDCLRRQDSRGMYSIAPRVEWGRNITLH